MFYCLVVGSRTFENYSLMVSKLDTLLRNQSSVTIISGGARGADTLAARYTHQRGYDLREFPAQWDTYGKAAGYRRNEQMHKYISQFDKRGVVAFWDGESRGTSHSFTLAEKYNNPIRIVRF